MVKDELGDRIKHNYENVSKTHLVSRMPVIIRLDGKAFHSFTRGFKRPFDGVLIKTMQQTMKYLCENIQGCVLGYTQSDEITLVLIDYKEFNTCGWFDNSVQKMCSVAASMATLEFNRRFEDNVHCWFIEEFEKCDDGVMSPEVLKFKEAYGKAAQRGALFDARAFNIPKEEVTNCLLWRQNDASRNSVEMVGRAYFSQTDLHKKSNSEIREKLLNEKNVDWDEFPVVCKRGSCCRKVVHDINGVIRGKWTIDENIPVFKGEGREYIDNLIIV